jgi:uncharacterized damage-inducible protein DinB
VQESKELIATGYLLLENLIDEKDATSWQNPIDTPFFGTVSGARLLAHVLYQNAHHAGQIALSLKRGKLP